MSLSATLLLGLIAGGTIIFGLPIARLRRPAPSLRIVLNAVAVGVLLFLFWDVLSAAWTPIDTALGDVHEGTGGLGPVFGYGLLGAAGLSVGLLSLVAYERYMARSRRRAPEPDVTATASTVWSDARRLSLLIAIGIGLHNFAEGLAIGQAAATNAIGLATVLVIGFALHNATEGFGIAAPLSGRATVPSWGQLAAAGIVGGGPTFLGTIVGYVFVSPLLSTFFLAIAAGALVFVIGELWALLKRLGGTTVLATAMVSLGFILALATEIIVGLNQRSAAAHQVTISASRSASRANTTSIAMRSPTETSRPQR